MAVSGEGAGAEAGEGGPGRAGLSGPRAGAGFRVEDQTGRAGDRVELTVRAEEELVAHRVVRVGEVAVGARAVDAPDGRLCVSPK